MYIYHNSDFLGFGRNLPSKKKNKNANITTLELRNSDNMNSEDIMNVNDEQNSTNVNKKYEESEHGGVDSCEDITDKQKDTNNTDVNKQLEENKDVDVDNRNNLTDIPQKTTESLIDNTDVESETESESVEDCEDVCDLFFDEEMEDPLIEDQAN